MQKEKPIIEAKKLTKIYKRDGLDIEILKDLDLKIYKNDFTVIMGRSGVGKSTLLFCLSSLDDISGGEVFILDENISRLSERKKANLRIQKTSFIFQAINLLPDLTLYENVTYVGYKGKKNTKKVNEEAENLLRKFDMWEEKDKYPSQVSGGQQQRIAVARALINDSQIIFGDEPTGALNSSATTNVLDIMTDLHKKGKSIVLVTHDVKVAARATRLLYINDGIISAELRMDSYKRANEKEREAQVLNFLVENGW